jgi:hypothetical protein
MPDFLRLLGVSFIVALIQSPLIYSGVWHQGYTAGVNWATEQTTVAKTSRQERSWPGNNSAGLPR